MRISDWSSDVCSSDLVHGDQVRPLQVVERRAPGVNLQHAALHQAEQAGQAVDRDDRRIALGIVALQDLLRLAAPGVLLEEALAADAFGAAQQRDRKSTRLNSSH